MSRPRLRLGLRTALALVAIAGGLSWVGIRLVPWARQMWARSVEYRQMADFVRGQPRIDLEIAERSEAKAREIERQAAPDDRGQRERADRERRWSAYHRKMAEYHVKLERWYRQGATRPWVNEPPMPEAPTSVPDPALVGGP